MVAAETLKASDKKPKVVQQSDKKTGCLVYRSLLDIYDWDVDLMTAIMKAESGCKPDVVGDNYPIAGVYAPSCGLLQIRTLAGRPSCEILKDPKTNIEWAYKIFKSQGYNAWTVYQTSAYKRFL